MTTLGTPNAPGATRVLLLGSGELGKEVSTYSLLLICHCFLLASNPGM